MQFVELVKLFCRAGDDLCFAGQLILEEGKVALLFVHIENRRPHGRLGVFIRKSNCWGELLDACGELRCGLVRSSERNGILLGNSILLA